MWILGQIAFEYDSGEICEADIGTVCELALFSQNPEFKGPSKWFI
jgi:hypothetical protein